MSSLPIQRARPVIELNLNVEEAMIETVDLLRTIRVQLEAITGTVNERLNRTFTDAGEDLTKIIHNVETLSSNLADSTGQLYHPIMFSLIFLLFLLVLAATLACILCKISGEIQRRKRNQQPYEYLIKSGTSTTSGKLQNKNLKKNSQDNNNLRKKARRKRLIGWLDRLRRPNTKTKGNKNNETEEYSTDILKEESGGIQSFA
uniref:Uncharacterized protein n=1 Tax=Meloidogyne enterolobii TaxID=390850 RepID=A0A6V7W4V5_MELEN|nr:unnamed protein product [Meloidogyne enterolobii]